MKKLLAALTGLSAVASSASAQTPTPRAVEFYVQPAVLYVFPGEFDNTAGAALSIGATFADRHSVEVEAMQFETDKGNDYYYTLNCEFTPLLLSYKYRIEAIPEKLSCYVGLSAGATLLDATASYDYPFDDVYDSSASHRSTAFTYGAQAGARYTITPRITLELGGRLLTSSESGFIRKGNLSMISAGLAFRL